ncbi:MAG: tetratricopeptide repeat protein, partial [Myxococcota bacterium]
ARAPGKPVAPELGALRRQLLGGDPDGARDGLRLRLDRDPADVGAWTLLAQLEARTGRTAASVAAWREVIARGTAAEAQRARFEAAVVAEGDPAAAIPLLEQFLATPDPLAAEATVRLGRARRATGDESGARAAFEAVIRDHPGSAAADAARTALSGR